MPRLTASRVIGMWTRSLLDEVAPDWRSAPGAISGVALGDPAAVRGNDPYIFHEDMVALWAHHTANHSDRLFGLHFAERHADRAVGLYAYAAAHAPDFGTGARACLDLQRLIDTHSDMTMMTFEDGIIVSHAPPRGAGRWPRHLSESLLGGCVYLGRQFTGVHLTPREVHVQHAFDGADPGAWFGCTVRYEQARNALVFDRATQNLPFRHADSTQFAAILAAATRTIEAVAPPNSLVDEVRTALRARQGTRTSIAQIARALSVSERTLQRRLAEVGATFRQLVDEVRVEVLAEHTITPRKGHVTAGVLGFADPSSIRRLRKRWRARRR